MSRNKQVELSESKKKWNKLWDMYGSGELEKYNYTAFVVCDYESGINSEGHSGWFFNTENTEGPDAMKKILSALKEALPEHIYDNLNKAFKSYDTENEENVCEETDEYFYEYEQEIIDYLQGVADSLEL